MRLLVLSPAVPYPATNGLRMRTWAVLRALAQEGHELSLIAFGEGPEALPEESPARQVCRALEIIPLTLASLSSSNDYAGRLRSLCSPYPHAVARFSSEVMRARISDHLSGGKYDAVLCETPYVAFNVAENLCVPLILDMHNLEHILLERYLQHEPNPAKRAYALIEARKLRNWEWRVCRLASLVLTCSEPDRQLVCSRFPSKSVEVAPNVVEVNEYPPAQAHVPLRVLFTGGMDWHPNRDAVRFFVRQVLPKLATWVQDLEFVIAGRTPTQRFREEIVRNSCVRFTGTIPDMRQEIAKAAVCVVPVRIGSGTRLKILEAAAMSKPIVSTTLGAEGLDFVDGQEICLADSPESFARAVADLLLDPGRSQALGEAARRRVEESYSLAVLRRRLTDALTRHAKTAAESTTAAAVGPDLAMCEVKP